MVSVDNKWHIVILSLVQPAAFIILICLIDRDTALLDTQNMFNIICLFLSLFVFPVLITIFLRRASDYPETTNATDNNKRS